MKALLIYNDNIAPQFAIDFNSNLGIAYKFQIGKQELLNQNFTIDSKIDSILKNEIEKCKYDCIFIPYSLSDENYLEFVGLRFASHIRLTNYFNNIQTPIIFFGHETSHEINRLSNLGTILFTRGIYQTEKITIKDFENQVKYIKNNYKEFEQALFIKKFIEQILISPSGNYATHHSVTNEWSIYRWANALKVDNENIQAIEKTIGSNLYFKYLKAKYPIKEFIDANEKSVEKGRILYVDDEIEKGWDSIFRKICLNKNCELARYKSIGANFKSLENPNEIIETVLNEVEIFKPDVVLLDFRLHDMDFETTKPEEVTGFKILQQVKKTNEGIQVIILSATNKIWNLMELEKAGADGFILKESPDLSVDEDYSKNAIEKIYETLNKALEKKYLKSIYSAWMNTKNKNTNVDKSFIAESDTALEIAWEQVKTNNLDFGFLTLFQSIEGYSNKLYQIEGCQDSIVGITTIDKTAADIYKWLLSFKEDKHNGSYFLTGSESKDKSIKPQTLFKISCLFKLKYDMDDVFLRRIGLLNKLRNKIAHDGVKSFTTTANLIETLKIIEEIRNN